MLNANQILSQLTPATGYSYYIFFSNGTTAEYWQSNQQMNIMTHYCDDSSRRYVQFPCMYKPTTYPSYRRFVYENGVWTDKGSTTTAIKQTAQGDDMDALTWLKDIDWMYSNTNMTVYDNNTSGSIKEIITYKPTSDDSYAIGRTIDYKIVHNIYPGGSTIYYEQGDSLINYVFPVTPGSTYVIRLDEVGNRLRSVFTTTEPTTITSGISATNIVDNPDYSVGYIFKYTPQEYGYIVVYVSNASETPKITVLTDGVGGDKEYSFQIFCTENTSGTSQSASLTTYYKSTVLATVTTRSETTYPSDWTLMYASDPLNANNSNQRMAFLCKKVEAGELVNIDVFQATAARIYINLIAVSGTPNLICNKEQYFTDEVAIEHSVIKASSNTVIWGLSAPWWSTANCNPWKSSELTTGVISLPEGVQGRQANFIDSKPEGVRTFTADTETATIINYVEIVNFEYKYLIKSEDVIYTVVNNTLVALDEQSLSASIFRTYGVTSVPNDLLLTLENPELFYWQGSENELPALNAKLTATPHKQYVVTPNLPLNDLTTFGINNVTIDCSGNPLFSCSFDNGTTWKYFNESDWVDVSDDVLGMTAEVFTAITTEQWADTIDGLESFKVRFILSTAEDKVTNIIVDYIN